ncbi:MAG: hypothetical protein AAFV33_02960 [Chloroflexota bacterium]
MLLRYAISLWGLCIVLVIGALLVGQRYPADLIAFESNRGNLNLPVIFLLDLRTGLLEPVTSPSELAIQPTWSPDGGYLAYQSAIQTGDGATSVIRAFPLSNPGAPIDIVRNAIHPAWSPDGRYIAFSRYDGMVSTNNIHVYDLQTRMVTNIAPSMEVAQYLPAWSPDGAQIAVNGTSPFNRSVTSIYTFEFAQPPEERVFLWETSDASIAAQPVWLDAASLLFTSSTGNRYESLNRTMAASGSADVTISLPLTFIEYPDVSSDGTRIVFSARDASGQGTRSLYMANPDGTDIRRLTYPDDDRTADTAPVWRPRLR